MLYFSFCTGNQGMDVFNCTASMHNMDRNRPGGAEKLSVSQVKSFKWAFPNFIYLKVHFFCNQWWLYDAHGRHKYKQKSLLPETRPRRTSSTRPSALTTVEKVTLCYIKSCKQLQGGNIHNTPNVVRQRSFRWTDITYSASSKLVYLWVRCFILGKESRSDLSELIDVLFFFMKKKTMIKFLHIMIVSSSKSSHFFRFNLDSP